MSRQSRFELFLGKFPEAKRKEIESLVMSAPTVKQGFNEVRKLYKYKGGYDTVLTWVNARKSVRPSEAARTSVEEEISTAPPNAIQEVQALYRRVNRYCDRVLDLLEAH